MKKEVPMKILVASGGEGPEREVSLASGEAVTRGLLEGGYEAKQIVLSQALDILEKVEDAKNTLVFIALHGSWGENGIFQSFLEMHRLAYTGTGPRGCMMAMEKNLTKLLFTQKNIPTPWWSELSPDESFRKSPLLLQKLEEAGLVVKPESCGSTVGISVVRSPEELDEAVAYAKRFDSRILVEEYIPGRELTVAVWDDGTTAESLPVVEIRPKSGFYSYDSKYTKGATEYLAPAPLSEEMTEKIGEYARKAHKAVQAQIYSRGDLRLSPEGKPFFLEVNTAPGMTDTSLVPKAAAARGWSFSELVCRIAETSWKIRRF